MITKIELENFSKDADYIQIRKQRIMDLLEQTQKITSTLSNMARGTSIIQDKMAENLVKMMDMQNEVLDALTERERRLHEIESEIEKLDSKYRNVVYLHYIENKTWEQVADTMHYERDYVCRLNGIALEKLKRV